MPATTLLNFPTTLTVVAFGITLLYLFANHEYTSPYFQNPYEFLDPCPRVYDNVSEFLLANKLVTNSYERRKRVIQALGLAGLVLMENYLYKYPYNLSDGERQCIGIAIALVLASRVYSCRWTDINAGYLDSG